MLSFYGPWAIAECASVSPLVKITKNIGTKLKLKFYELWKIQSSPLPAFALTTTLPRLGLVLSVANLISSEALPLANYHARSSPHIFHPWSIRTKATLKKEDRVAPKAIRISKNRERANTSHAGRRERQR